MPNIASSMKEWKYTFDPVSKADWIRQITTDLKQKPFESLINEWWEGEPKWPILHDEDMTAELVRLPDFLFNRPPQITEQISTASISPETVNKTILEALQFGAQSIILQLARTGDYFNAQWIKDVHLDWITIQIEEDTPSSASRTGLLKNLPKHVLVRILRGDSSTSLSSILQRENTSSPINISAIRFIYHFPSSGIWTEKTTATLNTLVEDLHQWENMGFETSTFFNQCILVVEADPDYFKQIIQTRTLHVLWQNINHHFSKEGASSNDRYMETHVEHKKNEKPDLFLIRASMSALAASLAGTGSLCIHQSMDDSVPMFYRRINRNIQHLLELECGMYKGTDPMSGAYTIDFHIKRWVAKIWDGLNPGK